MPVRKTLLEPAARRFGMKAVKSCVVYMILSGSPLMATWPASAQGIEDLVGYWCEAGIYERTRGTCIDVIPPGFPARHAYSRAQFTVQGGEIITMEFKFYYDHAPNTAWGWRFRALRGGSFSTFTGSLEEFQPEWGVCNSTSATATVSPSRKVMVLRYRGHIGHLPCVGTIGEREAFLRRIE